MFWPLTASRWASPDRLKSSRVAGSMRSSWPRTKPRASAACASGMPRSRAASARRRTTSRRPGTPPLLSPVGSSSDTSTTAATPRRRRDPACHGGGSAVRPRSASSAPTWRSSAGKRLSPSTRPSAVSSSSDVPSACRRGGAVSTPVRDTSWPGSKRSAPASMPYRRAEPATRPTKHARSATGTSHPRRASTPPMSSRAVSAGSASGRGGARRRRAPEAQRQSGQDQVPPSTRLSSNARETSRGQVEEGKESWEKVGN